MPRKKTRRHLYAVLLVLSSVVVYSAVFKANTVVSKPASLVAPTKVQQETGHPGLSEGMPTTKVFKNTIAPLFNTIIQGANEEVVCPNDGSTLAKFFLCGTSDIRTISLNVSGAAYQWQRLDPNTCAPSVIDDCPTINTSCTWNTVGSNATYDLSAAGEYRVRVDSGQFYYFKVTQNPLNPQLIHEDIVCGNPGRVEVTNVPSGYEYSLNSAAGPYQTDPFFDIAAPGNYNVWVRLIGSGASACLFPSNTVTVQNLDITVEVTKNDIQCSGEQGGINVDVSGVPGFYTYRLIKDGITVDTFGPNGADSYTFANVGRGVYSVRVVTNDCDVTITNDTSGNPIEIGTGISPLDVSATASDSFGCGATTVDVTVNTSGGTAPYRFSQDGGVTFSSTYTASTQFAVNASGTYNLLIEDANGCQRTASVDVADIPPPTFNIASFDANCGGANDGQIVVNLTNGFGYNIEYSIDNGTTYQVSNVFSSLAPGAYDIMLRYTQDAFSCTTPSQSTSVSTPTTINATATADTLPSCTNETGGQITISGVSGGTAPYEYSIGAGFSPSDVFANLGVGTYTPLIRDANGCVQNLADIVFAALDKPTDLDFAISSLDCITTTASVVLTVTDGIAPYTYEIISPSASAIANGNNPTFTNLGLGTYTFQVTDAVGCSYTENYAITDISSIQARAQQLSPITCFGDSDGTGRFIIDGFTTTYSYSLDGGTAVTGQNSSTIDLNGLAAGSYVLSVTDEDTNCTDTVTLTIEGPAAALTIDSLDVEAMSCQNGNVGSVRINTSGGWGGNRYTVTLPDGSTRGPRNGRTFSNLSQTGDYDVSVTDTNGCTVTIPNAFTLTALSAPTLTVDVAASDFCYDAFDAASLVMAATGGQAPYEYRINGGPLQASDTFLGLNPGNYTIELVDANDCRDSLNLTIQPQLVATASIIQELECSGPDASIQVTIADGYPTAGSYVDYDVYVNGILSTANNAISGNTFVHTVPNDGSITADTSFRFVVRDSQGCENTSDEVVISPTETIAGSTTVVNTSCGNANGIVTLIPDTSQGIAPYEYSNDGGATFGSQNIFSGYAAGSYSNFLIRDSRGCVSPPISAIIAPSVVLDASLTATQAQCSSATSGSIDASITNGVAPFDYRLMDESGTEIQSSLTNPSNIHTFNGLPTGVYTVVTRDAQGCQDLDTIRITDGDLTIIPVPDPLSDCATGLTLTIEIVGGTGPFLLRLVGEAIPRYSPNNPPRIHTFSGLDFGTTYFVEVEDTATGCIYIEEIPPFDGPSPLDVTVASTNASCDALGSGTVSYTVTGATGATVDISIVNTTSGALVFGPTSVPASGPFPDLTGLQPGNYQVLAEDPNNGCEAGAIANVALNAPSIQIVGNIPATCNAGALITVNGQGGTAPYSYAFVPNGAAAPTVFSATSTFEISGPYPSDYDFYVQDANGCIALVTDTASEGAGIPAPTIDVINQCTATSGYQINVTSPLTVPASGPETTFQYDIGSGFQDSPNFVVPNPGTYTITIRDGNGCFTTINAEVFDFFSITADATSVPTCNAGDGVITVSTSGGSGVFDYQLIDNGTGLPVVVSQPTNVFTNILPGDYSVIVTDLNSNTAPLCSDTATVEVSTVDSPIISGTLVGDISCFGANDGTIQAQLQTGTDTDTPLTFILYDGGTTTVIAGPQGSPLFDNLAQGTYQVEVTSNRGCTDRTGDIVINEPTALQLNTLNTEFSCNPSSNQFSTATITAFVDTNGDGSGTPTGTGPYTYSMDDGTPAFDGSNFQTSNVFEVIDNGTNQSIVITARDQNGCDISTTVNINAPTDLTFSFNVNGISCDTTGFGISPGNIEIVVDQGSGNYEVEILPLGSEPARSSGGTDRVVWPISTPGDYIFAVTDLSGGGCSYLTPIVNMPEYNTIEATIAEVRPVSCFGGNDGEISIQIANYTGVYNYEVFSRDNAGAETSTGVTGTFDTNTPIATPEVITGLPAGNLVVRVEALDSPFCDVLSNLVTVRSPDRPLTLSLTQTAEVTCSIPGQGEITVSGDGGWGSYQYRLVAPDGSIVVDYPNINPIFPGLSEGIHTVFIRDNNNCEESLTIDLALPTAIFADVQVVSPLRCNNDNDGSIEAFNITGGQGPGNYQFQLNRLADGTNSGLQVGDPVFTNLSAGDYTITVFDGWNCSYTTVPITIQDPEIVNAELVELQPPGCGDLGRMLLTVTNPEVGVSYFYRRSGTSDAFEPFSATDPLATSVEIAEDITLDPGPFQYDVQNSNGCPFELSNQISLDPAAPLVIDLDLTNATINCAGEATGIIRSEAFGGIGNYVYTLLSSDAPPFPSVTNTLRPAQDSGIFRNLPAGTYFVFAQSGGCEAISPPIIIDPRPPLVLDNLEAIDASCFGEMDGQIILEASGGTGVIRYSISDTLSEFFEGDDPATPNRKTFTDLEPRQYDIIVQDELGCTITRTVVIGQPMELVAGVGATTPETCLGDADGTATITVTGGTAPYFTSVNSADDADFVQNDGLFFDNLEGGETYVVFVRDSAGCETNVIVDIGIGVDLVANPIVEYGCDGIFPNSTVTIDLQDMSMLSQVLFSLDVDDIMLASDVRVFGDLVAGEHIVYIYHENGCVTTTEFEVDSYDPLMLIAEKTGPNEVTATATGGFGGYEYFFQGDSFGQTNIFTINEDANINIMVRDQNGCVANLVLPFDFEAMPEFPDFFTPDGDGLNDEWFPNNFEFFPNLEVKIFDRYGRVVAILAEVKGWDGTYEGKPLPTGDYWYVANANDKEKQRFVGHFTLYR
ncbi:Two component regulator three Y domain-containing protein [Croceitalea dokdonensis DOKDO 023]|uniref:Two component regulator three Y domain-containing protein n=1 Tax=Croceitalea dokdonensis DOKDO 023 TaxID=1300341 RepID=A0A0N8H3V8_9FLAO|nr:T9SS type B sorting domain-containing protein [Croceitalea dokdonensis]KPM31652.1 Two component regulator three Y domain-containing protein [Croceitalea dokdonensis DOKDO 023]